jgi:hypothetical protein
MALQNTLTRYSVALVALALGACATNVQHYADAPTAHLVQAGEPIRSVTVTLSPDGQRDFADNSAFDQNALLASVHRVLQAKQLYAATTGRETLEIQITAIRVRSTFNAVMWGFMAGSDNLRGDVYVRDPSGKLVNHFSVYASYALGGFVGGVRSVRWGWLYNKFAELVAENLTS